jgi:hypothetical protein
MAREVRPQILERDDADFLSARFSMTSCAFGVRGAANRSGYMPPIDRLSQT